MEKLKRSEKTSYLKNLSYTLIVVSLECYCPFTVRKTNIIHVDDNLASSGHKKLTASRSYTLMAELV